MKNGWSFLSSHAPPLSSNVEAVYFARCFGSQAGKKVLDSLVQMTKNRALSPEASTNALWFMEGQRALVAHIENLIEKGKSGDFYPVQTGEENG